MPNLRFGRWNYRWGKPEDLEPADVLLCSLGVVHHVPDNSTLPDPAAVRRSGEYLKQRDHAIGYFSLWRAAAKPDAHLFAVLRLRLFPRFLAWMDAAQSCGWTPLLDRLWHVEVPAEGEPLPGLAFQARQSEPLAEEAVLERWTWFNCPSHVYARLRSGAALATYRKLLHKTMLTTREFLRQGVLTREEVGINDEVGYVFTHDAAASYRLVLVSHGKAKQFAAEVHARGLGAPIIDDAVIEEHSAPVKQVQSPSLCPFFAGSSPIVCALDDD